MNDSISNVKRALTHAQAGHAEFTKAANILASGPSSYYVEKLAEYVEALFGRCAPFHEHDRVRLTAAPNTNNGWKRSAHFLITGAEGEVSSVDYSHDQFLVDVVFDSESWIDDTGTVRPPVNKHAYRISERILELV